MSGQRGRRFTIITGVGLGIGVMGALDEIVFHQLLQWHNFYVHTGEYWRTFSDGLFHVFTTFMLFWSALRLWSLRGRADEFVSNLVLWGGFLLGAGGFQLFDGVVNHKLLNIHPVREDTNNILVYDVVWNAGALALLFGGWLMLRWARQAET